MNDSSMLAHALGEVSDLLTGEKIDQAISFIRVIQICEHLLIKLVTRIIMEPGMVARYKAKAMYRLGKAYKLKGEFSERH
ncbi:MAG: hypothetical protein IPI68_10035 [Chitinophagaceae bacterium]|nr:hypothetical protein [Chitinophagaceae bacterium]